MKPRTLAVHAGADRPAPGRAVPSAPALEQATAPLLHDLDDLEAAYEGQGVVYRRYGSPNQWALERALAELEAPEGGEAAALVTGSGMAAISLACLALPPERRRVVASAQVYGGTSVLLNRELPGLGIETALIDADDPEALERALPGAGLLLVETIANPCMRVADLPRLAAAAHRHGAALLVDSTFATPVLCRPLEHGADIVMHSVTKYISGHGDALAGALIFAPERRSRLLELARSFGPSPSPMDCWLALRGLRTLALRVEAASATALRLAGWLAEHPAVERVDYPGLASAPDHALAARLLVGGFGGMVAFHLRGGEGAARHALRRLRLIPVMPSLADVATTVSHPFSTSHRGLSEAQLDAAGVTPGMVRLSCGIEDAGDLQADLAQALDAARPG
ncbi:MAG TPA: aminotransferase class I/II-fold pyridoxal phosphate-dependent enzyme [Candidatus Dormibacteraeota bacterium]|nr:aminotransferase class I/II-fold pyridoxal phosphate-dependent enzyme [Candidatus Dormibacteraeota bacterium]